MLKSVTFRSTLAAIACAISLSVHAMADTPRQINVPAGDLIEALETLAKQADVELVYRAEQLKGFKTHGVAGNLTPHDAVTKLLEGTPLRLRTYETGAMLIAPPGSNPTPLQGEKASTAATAGDGAEKEGKSNSSDAFRVAQVDQEQAASDSSVEKKGEQASQKKPVQLEEIVVTGTRIHGVAPVGSQVLTFDRDSIDRSGYGTTQDLLQSLSQNVAAGATESNTRGVGLADDNVDFGTGVNLRGLGTASTLVLIDGRRVAPGGYGSFVDVSTIPLAAIERVEIMPDGASALYGSDAVGGVVNILLRKHYDGAETTVRYGGDTAYHDGRINQLWGTSWQSGDFLLSYQYSHRGALAADARSYYTNNLTPFGGSDLRLPFSAPGNIVVGNVSYAIPAGQNGHNLSASSLIPGTINLRDSLQGTDILPQQIQNSIVTSAHQDLGAGVTLFGEGYFSKREFHLSADGYGGTLSVPKSNPFFVSPVPGAQSVEVEYNFANDVGHLVNSGRVFAYTSTLGADFEWSHGWRGEIAATYSADDELDYAGNQVNSALLQDALADPNPQTAFNPFGSGGGTNPATINALRGYLTDYIKMAITNVDASADGPIFSLPGGEVRLAVGSEYRDETLNQSGIDFLNTTAPEAQPSSHLGRRVEAVYGEVFVPLFGAGNSVPGLYALDLSAAGRYERYSDVGTTGNPKVGLSWSPLPSLKFRASYGTSFQAPLLSELDETFNAYELFPLPDPKSPTGRTESLLAVGGGNSGLRPQTATTWTTGMDLHPASLQGTTFSVDYFHIDYTNLISTLGQSLLSVLAQQQIYAPLITRNPSAAFVNQIYASPRFVGVPVPPSDVGAYVNGNPTNLGVLQERGLDVQAAHAFHAGFGTLNLQGSLTYLLDYKIAETPSAPLVEMVNTLNQPVRFRMRDSIGWSGYKSEAVLYVNYVGGYKNTTVTPTEDIHHWITTDLHLAYHPGGAHWLDGFTVSLDVQNLLNAAPPFVNNQVGYGYDPVNANVLGRVVSLQVDKKW